jgi:hypothetical protein
MSPPSRQASACADARACGASSQKPVSLPVPYELRRRALLHLEAVRRGSAPTNGRRMSHSAVGGVSARLSQSGGLTYSGGAAILHS